MAGYSAEREGLRLRLNRQSILKPPSAILGALAGATLFRKGKDSGLEFFLAFEPSTVFMLCAFRRRRQIGRDSVSVSLNFA